MTDIPAEQDRRTRRSGLRSAYRAVKARHAEDRGPMDRVAERLTRWASSTWFFWVHVLWFALWIVWNGGAALGAFDPFPYGLLTMIVSLEAIFLAIFVLMTQQRESAIGELREELTLQIDLRIEEEVTKTLHLVAGLYSRLGYELAADDELEAMLRPLDPARIEREISDQLESAVTAGHLRNTAFAERWRRRREKS